MGLDLIMAFVFKKVLLFQLDSSYKKELFHMLETQIVNLG